MCMGDNKASIVPPKITLLLWPVGPSRFPTGSNYNIIIYNYSYTTHTHASGHKKVSCVHLREYVLYTLLRKLRHSRGLGQLMGVARNRTRARAMQEEAACSLRRNWN